MANVKKIIVPWSETAKTVYGIIRREVDGFLLNDVDGAFAIAPADPYVTIAEHGTIKGQYELSESRTVWTDGRYTVTAYRQAGGSPSPVADTIIGSGDMHIISDLEVVADVSVSTRASAVDITRLLGLTLDNAVEDDVVRDANGNKTSSILYHYNSAANATTHDQVTGVVGKYNVTASYAANKMALFKVVRVI